MIKKWFYSIIEKIYLSCDENLVYYDQLTKLNNRNYLDLVIRDKYSNKECDVIIIDSDNLKSVNDNYGHEYGDKVLKFIADTLRYLPNTSEIVRYGGDEFLMIVSNDFDYELFDNLSGIISYGTYHKKSTESLRHAMKQADYLMYENKHCKKVNRNFSN